MTKPMSWPLTGNVLITSLAISDSSISVVLGMMETWAQDSLQEVFLAALATKTQFDKSLFLTQLSKYTSEEFFFPNRSFLMDYKL